MTAFSDIIINEIYMFPVIIAVSFIVITEVMRLINKGSLRYISLFGTSVRTDRESKKKLLILFYLYLIIGAVFAWGLFYVSKYFTLNLNIRRIVCIVGYFILLIFLFGITCYRLKSKAKFLGNVYEYEGLRSSQCVVNYNILKKFDFEEEKAQEKKRSMDYMMIAIWVATSCLLYLIRYKLF